MNSTRPLLSLAFVSLGLFANAAHAAQQPKEPRKLRFDTGTAVELWTAAESPDGVAKYAITTRDGRTSGVRPVRSTLMLRRRAFDPLVPGATFRPQTLAASGSIRIVQFETQVLGEYTAALTDRGVEVLRVLHDQGLIVQVPSAAMEAELRALDFVRWVGPYHAEYRVESELLDAVTSGVIRDRAEYVIQVMRRGALDKAAVARAIDAMGGEVEPPTPSGFLLTATLTPTQLARVAQLDRVFWIEPKKPLVTTMNKVRLDGGADALEFFTGYTGQGVNGAIIDVGFVKDHPELASNYPIRHRGGICFGGHGTQVSGILFADGIAHPAERGLLPEGQPVLTNAAGLGDRYTHAFESLFPPYEVVFESNSWANGTSKVPGYPNEAFQVDDIVFLYDLLTVQGFGNFGTREALDPAWGKNIVTVGGIRHMDTQTLADDMWANAGSIGPAGDQRIKPDLCYWFDGIRTMAGTFGGTSAATPQVAGHFGLFYQMWHEEHFGNVGKQDSVFASRPRSATARAFLFNTPNPYPFTGPQDDLTRMHQGWGRPSVKRLYYVGRKALVVDEWVALRNLEQANYQVVVAPGQAELRATMVYTDPAGTSSSTKHRINNVDLRVTSPSGVSYWGNQMMRIGNETMPGGAFDGKNTTEQVWITNPEAGTWLVEVIAAEVIQDARPESPAVDVDFGLVVSPVEPPTADLGIGGAAGPFGAPTLDFLGSLVAGSPWRFDVQATSPFALTLVVLGDAQVNLPFGTGGTLVPKPDHVFSLVPDATGAASIDGVFPAGLSSGELYYAQVFEFDLLRPGLITSSNAMQLRLP